MARACPPPDFRDSSAFSSALLRLSAIVVLLWKESSLPEDYVQDHRDRERGGGQHPRLLVPGRLHGLLLLRQAPDQTLELLVALLGAGGKERDDYGDPEADDPSPDRPPEVPGHRATVSDGTHKLETPDHHARNRPRHEPREPAPRRRPPPEHPEEERREERRQEYPMQELEVVEYALERQHGVRGPYAENHPHDGGDAPHGHVVPVRCVGPDVGLVDIVGPDRVEGGHVPRHPAHKGRQQGGQCQP